MNRFRVNLHPALFYGEDLETLEIQAKTPEQISEEAVEAQRDILETNKNQNNEAMWSLYVETNAEGSESPAVLENKLQKQLKQLAKNKNINFARTNDIWRCSRAEKRLAISSSKVFMELLAKDDHESDKVEKMLNTLREFAKNEKTDLTDDEAEFLKKQVWINSKIKDIKNFYKSFLEYQNHRAWFIHLQGLMWVFFEKGINSQNGLMEYMKNRSVRISREEIRERWKDYKKKWLRDWRERARFDIIKDRIKENGDDTEKMLLLLCDFNLDWEVNTWDVWYRTWTQFAEVFRREVSMQMVTKVDAVKNLVGYANKMWLEMNWINSVEDLYEWMIWENWYENTRRLQNFIQNSPADFSDILRKGAGAWKGTIDAMIRSEHLRAGMEGEKEIQEALNRKVAKILASEQKKIEALYPDKEQSSNIMQQLTNSLATTLLDHAVNVRGWMAAGAALPLDKIIEGMSAGVNVWVTENGDPVWWLFIWWNRSVDLGWWTDVSVWVTGGTAFWFVPFGTLSVEIGQEINKWIRERSLDGMWVQRISLWSNVTVYGWWLFSRWVTAWYENNEKKWIEKQAEKIHEVIQRQAKSWVEAISTNGSFEDRRNALKDELENEFNNSSEDELDKAANNLMRILESFPIAPTPEDIQIYSKVVADVFTDMWRNNAIIGITDNKWKISGWKFWIQFLEWFVPIPTLVMKFTKYRNARTMESDNSRIRRIDAMVSWHWNEEIEFESWEKWIGAREVELMNDLLKQYWVGGVELISGENRAPGRIKVPASIWDKIDVRISIDLRDYVKIEEDWSYSFPANTTYRLLAETGWNLKSAVLNIGWKYNVESDVILSSKTSDIDEVAKLVWDKEFSRIIKGDIYQEWPEPEIWTDPQSLWAIEFKPGILNLFTDEVIKWLKTIDTANWNLFSSFVRNKQDALQNFDEAVNVLINILSSNRDRAKYSGIIEKLKNRDTSNEDKQLIIDRVLACSVDTDVHNQQWLHSHVRKRGNYYETLKGPNWQTIFDELSVKRDDIIKSLSEYTLKPNPNLIWATAFYNAHLEEDARWLSVTWLGVTNVFWGKILELNNKDAEVAKNWFWGANGADGAGDNYVPWVLDKLPLELNNLERALKEKLSQNNDLKDLKFTNDELKKILKWEEVEKELDNLNKKVKIKLDIKYVFYLMWECANESVGMELGNLSIQTMEMVTKRHDNVTDYDAWSFYINTVDGSSVVDNERRDVSVGISLGRGKDVDTEPGEKGRPIGDDVTSIPGSDTKDIETWWQRDEF